MESEEVLTVYWSPGDLAVSPTSRGLLYSNPESMFNKIRQINPQGEMNSCPAVKGMFKKIFSFDSAIHDEFPLPMDFLREIATKEEKDVIVPSNSLVGLIKPRKTFFPGYVNISYLMSWAMFASEPVVARMSAPFYPASGPVEGSLFTTGQFDIGRWYRPMALDWHVPETAGSFKFEEGQSIFYLELFTEKRVEFKRYNMTDRLNRMLSESVGAPDNYSTNKPLEYRYELGERSSLSERVLREIKRNLI